MKKLFAAVAGLLLCTFGFALAFSQNNAMTGHPGGSNVLINGGAVFTVASGTGACATTSTLVGGSIAGSFKCTGTAGASTAVITFGSNTGAPPNSTACWVNDDTSGVAGAAKTSSLTAVTLVITIATTSDVVKFGCVGF